jgi:hypothetical protein
MSKCKRRHVSPDEQHVLQHGYLLLLNSAKDIAQCDQAIRQHHYLRGVTLVGEHLRYAFGYRGRWLAVATWMGFANWSSARA